MTELDQVQASYFIHPSIHPWSHSFNSPSICSPLLSSPIHPSTHSSIRTCGHLLFNHFQDSSSTKFVWYFYYYAMETEYTHNMLAILFLLINQIINSPPQKKKKNWRLSRYLVCTGYSWGYGNCLNWVMKFEWAFSRWGKWNDDRGKLVRQREHLVQSLVGKRGSAIMGNCVGLPVSR